MDTERFIIHIKDEDLYKDNADDVKKRYDTSNYDGDRPLPKRMNQYRLNETRTTRKNYNRISCS